MYACLYRPPQSSACPLIAIAGDYSPRYETHRDDLVTVDVRGLDRLLGAAYAIGDELRRDASARGVRLHIAIAGTWTAALVLAQSQPGVTIVEPGAEAASLAPVPIAGATPSIASRTRSAPTGNRTSPAYAASTHAWAFRSK